MEAVEAIYAHHVLQGLATFETMPPPASELEARRETVVSAGNSWAPDRSVSDHLYTGRCGRSVG